MRTDIHTPSRIIPSDYLEIAVETMNILGLGDAQFLLQERETIRRHMASTGGTYAHVETSGSCQVCGNVQAIYLVLFYHEKSNTYIRVGMDCTQKLGLSGDSAKHNLFRKNVQNAREAQAGKRKAIAILGDLGLSEAWDIFTEAYPLHSEDCKAKGYFQGDDNGAYFDCTCEHNVRIRAFDQFPERTIRDIVGKLVTYGNVSDKQIDFVRKLIKQIADRPIVEAQRQAEQDAAGPAPSGRQTVTGTVLSVKQVETNTSFHYGDDGVRTKVLIRLENGSKVYGNQFCNLQKGETVTFVASFEVSDRDAKFGFYKRATIPTVKPPKPTKEQRELTKFISTVAYA